MSTTRVSQRISAPPSAVYEALLDPGAVAVWMVPDGMTSLVHEFDPREGGTFRISLSYEAPTDAGKTNPDTDTFHGRFIELLQDRRVVERVEFETENPSLRGEMMITITLSDLGGATELVAIHDHLPAGLSPEANETGWRMSLSKLARLVESHPKS